MGTKYKAYREWGDFCSAYNGNTVAINPTEEDFQQVISFIGEYISTYDQRRPKKSFGPRNFFPIVTTFTGLNYDHQVRNEYMYPITCRCAIMHVCAFLPVGVRAHV